MSPAEPGDGDIPEDFAHLPSTKLLTELVEWTRQEVILRWDGWGTVDEHPVLGQLWAFARTTARSRVRDEPSNKPATEFLRRVAEVDLARGAPAPRGWLISSEEADLRFDLITEYLIDSGLLSLRQGEKSAPINYLSKEELRGK